LWEDPIVVIGTVIPSLILIIFFGYLAWSHLHASASRGGVITGIIGLILLGLLLAVYGWKRYRSRQVITFDLQQTQTVPAGENPPHSAPGPKPPVDPKGVPHPTPPALSSATRPCPFCGEEIKVEARKCRFCGEILDPVLRTAQEAAWQPPPRRPRVLANLGLLAVILLTMSVVARYTFSGRQTTARPAPASPRALPARHGDVKPASPPMPIKRWYPQLGEVCRLRSARSPDRPEVSVYLCTDLFYWDRMLDAVDDIFRGGEGATHQTKQLILAKVVHLVPSQTRVRVLSLGRTDLDRDPSRVVVLDGGMDGMQQGLEGWVCLDDLVPLQPQNPSPHSQKKTSR
jgi:hypothetical protein